VVAGPYHCPAAASAGRLTGLAGCRHLLLLLLLLLRLLLLMGGVAAAAAALGRAAGGRVTAVQGRLQEPAGCERHPLLLLPQAAAAGY
jgi:hypothetical protein